MPLLNEPEPPPRSSRRGWLYALVLLALAGGGYYLYVSGLLTPSEDAERRAAVDAPPPSRPVPAAPAAPEPEPAAALAPESEPETEPEPELEPEPEPAAAPPPAMVLRVTSDVDGAEVFIDRRYAGTTPFESYEVEPGRHRINVSAPGYEGYVDDVEITGELTTVDVRFRQVRLDQRIAVVHKHRFGDCEGHLVATTAGIEYLTDDDDAFHVDLNGLEELAVDYMAHNLRLKVRGGRTYNFTDGEENADALFVFHRAVQEARERLARGEPAAAP